MKEVEVSSDICNTLEKINIIKEKLLDPYKYTKKSIVVQVFTIDE